MCVFACVGLGDGVVRLCRGSLCGSGGGGFSNIRVRMRSPVTLCWRSYHAHFLFLLLLLFPRHPAELFPFFFLFFFLFNSGSWCSSPITRDSRCVCVCALPVPDELLSCPADVVGYIRFVFFLSLSYLLCFFSLANQCSLLSLSPSDCV